MAEAPPLHVRIISPYQLILDTPAESVSSRNSQGAFDILPLHANFISVIDNQQIAVRVKGNSKPLIFQFPKAIIYNINNQVNIYTHLMPLPPAS